MLWCSTIGYSKKQRSGSGSILAQELLHLTVGFRLIRHTMSTVRSMSENDSKVEQYAANGRAIQWLSRK